MKKKYATLLGLIALLILISCGVAFFVKFKRKSERDGCIVNLRSATNYVRSYQGMQSVNNGDKLDPIKVLEYCGSEPFKCPSGGVYTWSPVMPEYGILPMRCSCPDHQPDVKRDGSWVND